MRRKFRVTILISLVLQVFIFMKVTAQGQDSLSVLRRWEAHKNSANRLYDHLLQQSYGFLRQRKEAVTQINSLQGWKERQEEISAKLTRSVGPFPERTPLNAKITKTLQKKNFRVEHIVYESRPGFWVPSSLFIPNGIAKAKKAPAIVYCSGHSPESYRNDVYQSILLNLVNKGFVVFAFDPVGQGERMEYYDDKTGKSIVGAPTREHALPGAQLFMTGNSLISHMIWDGIRAVDYLITRKEVDPSRIGITGRSGGGTQSAFIAALDKRISAVAPECYITNFTRLLESIGPQDAEQNMFHIISDGLDQADLLMAHAPKPAMMITTTHDFFSIQGAKETEAEVARIYEAYGATGRFSRVEDVAPHASTPKNREAMYAFFQKYLLNPGSAADESPELLTPDEMRVTETGQVVSSDFKSETTFSLNRKDAAILADKRHTEIQDLTTHLSGAVAAAKDISGYLDPGIPATEMPVYSGFIQKENYRIEKYFLKGEGDYVIPYLLFVPAQPSGKTLVYLHPGGKEATAAKGEIEDFLKAGVTVLAPDLIGQGEMGRGVFGRKNYFAHAPTNGLSFFPVNWGVMIGKSIVGIRAGDLVRLFRIIKGNPLNRAIYALAVGEIAPVLLHAAAFEPVVSGIGLVSPFSSYSSIVNERFYNPEFVEHTVPSALTRYDLPDLAASLAPAKLLIFNVTDGTGKSRSRDATPGVFIADDLSIITRAYAEKQAADNLNIIFREASATPDEILKWIL